MRRGASVKMTLKSGAPCVKATSRSSTARPQETCCDVRLVSVPAGAFLHRRELLGTGRTLVGRFPGLVGHTVDGLAALILAQRRALGIGLLLEPVGEAVAAEARQIHQVDVLDIAARAQMFDQTPKNGGFKFRSGFVVDGHGRTLAV